MQDALSMTSTCRRITVQRYRRTVRAALNDAMREGYVTVSVAEPVEIENGKRPKGVDVDRPAGNGILRRL